MELLKLLSAPELIAQAISFLILFAILRVFAWKKFLGILDKRREGIAKQFSDIESAKAELEKLKLEYSEKIGHIEEAARRKMQEAVDAAGKIGQEIKEDARKEALELIEKARQDIRLELLKAKHELKEEVIDLALKATENLIQEKLTDTGDRRLVEDFLSKLDTLELDER